MGISLIYKTHYFFKLSDFIPDFDTYLVRTISDPQSRNNISMIYFNLSMRVYNVKLHHKMPKLLIWKQSHLQKRCIQRFIVMMNKHSIIWVRKVKKITLSLRNRCGLFQVKAWLSRPKKNMAASDPSEGYPGNALRPREWGGWGSPDEGYN